MRHQNDGLGPDIIVQRIDSKHSTLDWMAKFWSKFAAVSLAIIIVMSFVLLILKGLGFLELPVVLLLGYSAIPSSVFLLTTVVLRLLIGKIRG